jgi:Putative zinc-finger
MSQCDDILKELDAYLDAELGSEALATVEAHLAACPACRKVLEAHRQACAAVASLPAVSAPADFLEKFTRARKQQSAAAFVRRPKSKRHFWISGGLLATAATVLMAVTVVMQQAEKPGQNFTTGSTESDDSPDSMKKAGSPENRSGLKDDAEKNKKAKSNKKTEILPIKPEAVKSRKSTAVPGFEEKALGSSPQNSVSAMADDSAVSAADAAPGFTAARRLGAKKKDRRVADYGQVIRVSVKPEDAILLLARLQVETSNALHPAPALTAKSKPVVSGENKKLQSDLLALARSMGGGPLPPSAAYAKKPLRTMAGGGRGAAAPLALEGAQAESGTIPDGKPGGSQKTAKSDGAKVDSSNLDKNPVKKSSVNAAVPLKARARESMNFGGKAGLELHVPTDRVEAFLAALGLSKKQIKHVSMQRVPAAKSTGSATKGGSARQVPTGMTVVIIQFEK